MHTLDLTPWRPLALTLLLGCLSIAAAPAGAQQCPDPSRTPAFGVPQALWGDLRPVDTGQLPASRDTTRYNEITHVNNVNFPLWESLDIQNGWIFASTAHGLQIWDATSSPASPSLVKFLTRSDFLGVWPTSSHEYTPIRWVAAPAGNDAALAVGLGTHAGGGVVIFNTTNKVAPSARYGDHDKPTQQVHAARIGGRDFAFAAATSAGVLAYDMTSALALQNPCTETTSPGSPGACGVFRGRIGSRGGYSIHGVGNASGSAHWLAIAGTDNALPPPNNQGVAVWNVSSPSNPQLVLTAVPSSLVYATAMWRSGSSYYLAARVATGGTTELRIYDVSCLGTGSCGSTAGAPIWTRDLGPMSGPIMLTYSQSGGDHFLYTPASRVVCPTGLQSEWLFNVSNPAATVDITPPPQLVGGQLTGYWGWYYNTNPTGFNWVQPRAGKFAGNYFYRAARGIFDIHQRTTASPPVASFTWSPSEVYADDPGVPDSATPVSFTDTSTGNPNLWDWTFVGGTPASSTAANPTGVRFATPGAKAVTLIATNAVGSSSPVSELLTVLDPAPVIGPIAATPNPALVCQQVAFTPSSVTGKPPLTYSWVVKDLSGAPVPGVGGSGPSLVWNTAGAQPGSYTGELTVANASGSATRGGPLTLEALSTLPGAGQFAPTNEPFAAGTVQFHVDVAGATEWCWSFGDGNHFPAGCNTDPALWSHDPVAGPNPSHTYAAVGAYSVTVQVRNCIEQARRSAPLAVDIAQISPLVASFRASGLFCSGGICAANTGQAINFVDESSGDPDSYAYAWNNTSATSCTGFGTPVSSPVTSHTYTSAGTFYPCLRLVRGSEQQVFVHALGISVATTAPPTPPSITVSGPSTGQVNQALAYTAAASNCSASPSGWTWAASGGGSVDASQNSASITWATAGTKQVTARNSACGTAQGIRNVNITAPPSDAPLNASFTFNPASPAPGQPVSFNASASTGAPTAYTWDFGDGSSGEGVQVAHTYAQGGNYTVRLTVSKPGTTCSFGLCISETTRLVVVGTSAPALRASFTTSASCQSHFGTEICTGEAGQAVSFTSTSTGNPTQLAWSFGDGGTANGSAVSHTWNQPGDYLVTLTAQGTETSDTAVKLFTIEGEPVPQGVLVPWIAQTNGALVQTSDLYVYNPAATPMQVSIRFLKRGAPEPEPPEVRPTIGAGATLYLGDVVGDLFDRENISGFLYLQSLDAAMQPVVSSFNRTFGGGQEFGQVVPGIGMDQIPGTRSDGLTWQQLIGLSDDQERLSYFGLTNPHDQQARYHLRFFDAAGNLLDSTEAGPPMVLARFGQRQLQVENIRQLHGIRNTTDYRVEVVTVEGGPIFPYGANIRLGTSDPAFIQAGESGESRQYLLGMLAKPGLFGSSWVADLVLFNPDSQPMTAMVRFLNIGVQSEPTAAVPIPLQPRQSVRLADVLRNHLSVTDGAGVLIVDSQGANGQFPVILGETYDDQGPGLRYGQTVVARGDRHVATAGKRQILVGLRQDAAFRTVLWLYNPGTSGASLSLVYRRLDGSELGRLPVAMPAGRARQVVSTVHPLPAGFAGSFTVEVVVENGQVLSAAQVVNNVNNDPAYRTGDTR